MVKKLFLFLLLIVTAFLHSGCINAEKSILFVGNGNNSDYNFSDLNVPAENRELKSFSYGGTTNYGLYIKGKTGINDAAKDKIVLFFHGNGGRIDKFTPLEMANFFYENGINFFAMEYRGYGQSKNFKTNEESTYQDAEFGYDYLLNLDNGKYSDGKIILMGHSLGSAVAIDLAVKKNEKSLILLSAFKDFSQELNELTSFEIPSNWITDAKYDNMSKIDKINSSVLFIHGEKDNIVKAENSIELYEKTKATKKLYLINNANHDDIGLKLDNKCKEEILSLISQ